MKIFSSIRSRYNASSVFALSLAFMLAFASTTYATLTFTGTAATSDAALTLNGAAASNIVIGSATTTGVLAIGAATHTGGSTWTSGATTANVLDVSATALTTGKVLDMSDLDAITTGKAIHIDATGVTQTDGILVHVDSASTALTSTGRLLLVDHTGASGVSTIVSEIKSAATDETEILKVTASGALAAGKVVDLTASSLTTGNVLDITYTGTTGSGIKVTDSTAADANAMVYLNNTAADATGQTYLIQGRYTDTDDAQADFLLFEDNNGDDVFSVVESGAIAYINTDAATACSSNAATVNLNEGNYHTLDMSTAANCAITFAGGTTGGIYLLQLEWAGNNTWSFAATTGQSVTPEAVCDASGGTHDDDGDKATLVLYMTSATQATIISCASNVAAD